MSVHGFRYLMFNSKDVGPSIEAGYGPYTSINLAIETILSIFRDDSSAEAYTTTGYAPPLGLHFGVIVNNVFTEYEYKSGAFTINNVGEGIVPVGSGGSITLSDVIPTGLSGDTGSSTTALSTKGAYALALTIANSNSGITDVKVNSTSVVNSSTKVANIPVAGDNALGVVLLGYSTNETNKFALKTSSNKAYVEIPQAYLVSAALKQAIDALVEVYEDGAFITDPNMEPSSGGGGNYSELETRIDRIEAILGQLMGNTSADDATFTVSNDD